MSRKQGLHMEKRNTDEAELAAEVAKVQEFGTKYAAAMNVGDFERWMALWDADGVRMPPNQPRSIGLEQIRATSKPDFDAFDFTGFEVYPSEIQVLGDWAFMHGLYEAAMTPKAGGDTLTFTGKYLSILKKQTDNSWKVYIDCFNGNEPLA